MDPLARQLHTAIASASKRRVMDFRPLEAERRWRPNPHYLSLIELRPVVKPPPCFATSPGRRWQSALGEWTAWDNVCRLNGGVTTLPWCGETEISHTRFGRSQKEKGGDSLAVTPPEWIFNRFVQGYSDKDAGVRSAMLPNSANTSACIVTDSDRTDPSPMPKFTVPLCSLPGARKSPLFII